MKITPSALTTKALDTNATQEESAVKTVDAFVYAADGGLERVEQLAAADGNEYTVGQLKIEKGKQLFIGVNLTASLIETIKTKGYAAALAAGVTDVASATNGFIMFNDDAKSFDLADENPLDLGEVTVSRVAAKVSVKKAAGMSLPYKVQGGQITSVEFATYNNNGQFFALPGAASPALGNVTDCNFNEVTVADDDANSKTVDPDAMYAMEYFPAGTPKTTDDVTYVRLRCGYLPVSYKVKGEDDTWKDEDNADSKPATFYLLENKTMGIVSYFRTEADANAYKADKTDPADDASVKAYPNGNCEYAVFLHSQAGNDFKAVRNYYYVINITSINGLGVPEKEVIPIAKESSVKYQLTVNEWIPFSADDIQLD